MSPIIGRGRYAGETYPTAKPASSSSASAAAVSVVNSVGAIPSAGPANNYVVELGGDGMPASPATFTTVTGKVKVTVVIGSLQSTVGASAGFLVQGERDSAAVLFGAKLFLISQTDSADGLGDRANGTFVGIDSVAPGSTHTWGVQVVGEVNEGGGHNTSFVTENFASVTVEDVPA